MLFHWRVKTVDVKKASVKVHNQSNKNIPWARASIKLFRIMTLRNEAGSSAPDGEPCQMLPSCRQSVNVDFIQRAIGFYMEDSDSDHDT